MALSHVILGTSTEERKNKQLGSFIAEGRKENEGRGWIATEWRGGGECVRRVGLVCVRVSEGRLGEGCSV